MNYCLQITLNHYFVIFKVQKTGYTNEVSWKRYLKTSFIFRHVKILTEAEDAGGMQPMFCMPISIGL